MTIQTKQLWISEALWVKKAIHPKKSHRTIRQPFFKEQNLTFKKRPEFQENFRPLL